MRFSRLITGFDHRLHKVKWQVNRALKICRNCNGTKNWHKQHNNGLINASLNTIHQEILVRLFVLHPFFFPLFLLSAFTYIHSFFFSPQIDSLWVKIWQSSGVQLRYRITSPSHHVSKTGSMKFKNTLGDPDGQPKLATTRNWCGVIPIWLDVASHTIKMEDVTINFGCATMDQGKFSLTIENYFSFANRTKVFIFFVFFYFVLCSGNVVGHQPYAVGQPSCTNYGMSPSSRYSGLCVTTATGLTANNEVYTQNTYTIKSERVNPTVYQSVQSSPSYSSYSQPQTTAVQAYQQALQQYQNPQQNYDQAQQTYQLALQAYNRAYSTPQLPQVSSTPSYTYQSNPSIGSYDWSAYFG